MIGAYLPAFHKLTSLHLNGCTLVPDGTAGWPKLSCKLTSLSLAIPLAMWNPLPHVFESNDPTTAEFDWFAHSSRDSLRHLTLSGCGHDILHSLLDWGHNLHSLSFTLRSDTLQGDANLVTRLGRLQSLREMTVVVEEGAGDEQDIRSAAAATNRMRQQQVVVVHTGRRVMHFNV